MGFVEALEELVAPDAVRLLARDFLLLLSAAAAAAADLGDGALALGDAPHLVERRHVVGALVLADALDAREPERAAHAPVLRRDDELGALYFQDQGLGRVPYYQVRLVVAFRGPPAVQPVRARLLVVVVQIAL